MTVVVLGSSGQLASHLKEALPNAHFLGRASLDLTDLEAIPAALDALAPSAIVNAAAYTAVDKAESEADLAWRLNTEAVAAIARTAAWLDIPLVHVSTDYVFDGHKVDAYDVNDPIRPLSVYGSTKLGGELAVRTLCPMHWILRTSWVFSEHGANFVKTMLRLAAANDTLRVVADQRGRPTYAGDLASVIAALLSHADPTALLPYGTYHAVGGPVVSWHEFAETIFEAAQKRGLLARRPTVQPIPSSDYPTPAPRPYNSVLAPSEEIESALGIHMDWHRGLDIALAGIGAVSSI